MAKKIVKGLLYKKIKEGTTIKTVPFLPKTLTKLIFRDDGTNLEDTLKTLDNLKDGATCVTYQSKEAYDEARESGEVKDGTLVAIPRDNFYVPQEPVIPPEDEPDNTEESNGNEETGGTEESIDTPSTDENPTEEITG